jgi:hypothetical protein
MPLVMKSILLFFKNLLDRPGDIHYFRHITSKPLAVEQLKKYILKVSTLSKYAFMIQKSEEK